jgi:hypothetical protein
MEEQSIRPEYPWMRNGMPSLDHLVGTEVLRRFTAAALTGRTPDGPEGGYVVNLARLADKVVIEYEAARTAWDQMLDSLSPTLLPFWDLLRIVNHLENCIISLDRVLQFLDALVEQGAISGPPVRGSHHCASIRRLRNAIAHTDERLQEAGLSWSGPVYLRVEPDRAWLGTDEVRFHDLAQCIEVAYATTVNLMDQ